MSQETHELWARCLLHIERHVRPQSFDTWFRPTTAKRFDADILEIEVSSSYFADWVGSNYLNLIQRTVEAETGLTPKITFSVADAGPGRPATGEELQEQVMVSSPSPEGPMPLRTTAPVEGATADLSFTARQVAAPAQGSPSLAAARAQIEPASSRESFSSRLLFTPLNQRYTFGTFIVGEANRFAHAAAQAVSHSPGQTQFNPSSFTAASAWVKHICSRQLAITPSPRSAASGLPTSRRKSS